MAFEWLKKFWKKGPTVEEIAQVAWDTPIDKGAEAFEAVNVGVDESLNCKCQFVEPTAPKEEGDIWFDDVTCQMYLQTDTGPMTITAGEAASISRSFGETDVELRERLLAHLHPMPEKPDPLVERLRIKMKKMYGPTEGE